VRLGVFGPVVVMTDDGPVALPSRRERALLGIRPALHAGRIVDHDTLAEAVFGAEPPARPRHALATLVLRVRDRLGPSVVVRAEDGYQLDETVVAVDADFCEQAVRPGLGLAEAMAWWRGRPYAEYHSSGTAREGRRNAASPERCHDGQS
jgi:DNA-binding SARP family transcriptional activator